MKLGRDRDYTDSQMESVDWGFLDAREHKTFEFGKIVISLTHVAMSETKVFCFCCSERWLEGGKEFIFRLSL
jgi:hypothetical protein